MTIEVETVNVKDFFDAERDRIKKSIIRKLKRRNEFSSHDFIKEFSRCYESQYLRMLLKYIDKGNSFQSVHGQIAKYLSNNSKFFNIEKSKKEKSENVHGTETNVQWWKRTTPPRQLVMTYF